MSSMSRALRKLATAAPGKEFYAAGRQLNMDGRMVSLDAQDPGQPTVGPRGGTVGTTFPDGTISQQWKEQRVTIGGVYSHR